MKIYTKTGDRGTTSLIGGTRVPKYHPRIEAYGTVDELMAYVGLLHDQPVSTDTRQQLVKIQDRLMCCSSELATDSSRRRERLPSIANADIEWLEQEIDGMEATLEPLGAFILPGGHQAVSVCHICRTVCRRAERLAIKVAEETAVPENVLIYLNRLSDFFFTLSRKLGKDLNIEQIKWHPGV